MKTLYLSLLAFLALGLTPAHALTPEVMPPASELTAPGSEAPAAVATVTTTTTQPAPQERTLAPATETATGMPGDPCPNLRGAAANAPDDLSKVQQDIDRFTLCVQRAQLLERLNESAIKSIDQTDAALGLGGGDLNGLGGVLPTGPANMPPLPAGALAGADVTPTSTTSDTTTPATVTPTETATAEPETPWLIREIFGSSVDMQARLLSPQGDELKVKKGEKLSDGSVVTSITPEGVSIRGSKGVKSLQWATDSSGS